MPIRVTLPIISTMLLTVSNLAGSMGVRPVHAAAQQPPDPCSASVGSISLFIRGGSSKPQLVLRGGGNVFSLSLFTDERNPASLPGDTPRVFSFERGTTVYFGLVHAFHHGTHQHLCFNGSVLVLRQDKREHSLMRSVHNIQIRLDGIIAGRMARVTLIAGHANYWVYGTVSTS